MGEAIHHYWADSEYSSNVVIFTLIDDLYQPYSCEAWGVEEDPSIPLIIDDGLGYEIYNWFSSTPGAYPLNIFIDHQMRIYHIYDGIPSEFMINSKIFEMLERGWNKEND